MFFRFLHDQPPRKKPEIASRGTGPSAMVLLDAPPWRETPTENRRFAALCDTGEIRIRHRVATAAAIEAGTVEIALMVMSSALPEAETRRAAASSPLFPGARNAVARHAGHLFVGATCGAGFEDQRRTAMAVSIVAAAFGGLGVYWPPAGVIATPGRLARVREDARAQKWPMDVWIGAQLFGEWRPGGNAIGAMSRGAAAFFGYEIAVGPRVGAEPSGQLRSLYTVAARLMTTGPVLRDGDFLEPEATGSGGAMSARLRKSADGAPDVMELRPAALQ